MRSCSGVPVAAAIWRKFGGNLAAIWAEIWRKFAVQLVETESQSQRKSSAWLGFC